MSAVGSGEVLKPILLRSSTPAANEKVLLYLESIERTTRMSHPSSGPSEGGRDIDPVEQTGPGPVYAPSPRGSKQSSGAKRLEDLAGSQVSYNGGGQAGREDDADSNVQDGQLSELGTALPIPPHEPGPNDPPGPRYESFDSGPSFGNFGPMPESTAAYPSWGPWQPNWNTINTPNRAAGVPLPDGSVRSPTAASHKPWGGSTTAGITARGIPLPDSVVSPTSAMNPEEASTGAHKAHKSPSKASHRSKSVVSDDQRTAKGDSPSSPKAASRVSKAPAVQGADEPRSSSPPKSQVSAAQSAKSRGTARTRGTEKGTTYPPLPDSTMGESRVASPSSRSKAPKAASRAYSISPSDSPSQPPKPHKLKSPTLKPVRSVGSPSEADVQAEPLSPKTGSRLPPGARSGVASPMSGGQNTHQSRPFSPYRHAATNEDLLHAAILGAGMAAQAHPKSPSSKGGSKLSKIQDADVTPTPSRPHSPSADLDQEEEQIVRDALVRTPYTRTSYAASALEPEVANSHFHDMDLCILLHQVEDPMVHEVVKKALRKAIRQRVKKLGIKHDNESIRQYTKSFHDHDPSVHLHPNYSPSITQEEPPEWAKELMEGMARMSERIETLGPKIERLKLSRSSRSYMDGESRFQGTFQSSDIDRYAQTPMTQTVNIHTQPTGTMAESMFQAGETEIIVEGQTVPDSSNGIREEDEFEDDDRDRLRGFAPTQDGETRTHGPMSDFGRDDSPGQQYLEEELYKLRVKPGGSQSGISHRTWEVARDDDDGDYEEDRDGQNAVTESGLPEIPDSGNYTDNRQPSPPLPPIPQETRQDLVPSPQGQLWHPNPYGNEQSPPPWQRIHQRLLSWAIIWPMSELDTALNSTTRGQQVDEVALSIWSTQTYKRYVRSKMTDSPPGRVDRLFVPPNMADAINTAVFHGRHGDASGMLRDLWSPFGLDGMPRLLIVLAKHRTDENHWVVHRFSLPDGALTTYDSFPERTLPDGRPLGWWFAIRVAWPNAIYPSPDHLMQKMVRLHRPMQLGIDNSVAAAGIWRNLLMGSRAERSLDLERLRDLINTEVKNLRQRKQQGKLSIGGPRPNWEDMN